MSTCEAIKKCLTCGKSRRTGEQHLCFHYYCAGCKKQVLPGHERYMQQLKPRKKSASYIFFDFEAMQTEEEGTQNLKHEVNLCCVEKVCDDCHSSNTPCNNCGERYHTFCNTDEATSLDCFCKYLFGGKNKNCIAFAHNMQGYDGVFILGWLQKNAHRPKVIMRGHKIMRLEFNGVVLLDSLNFLPMALAKIPDAMGFEGEKGFFPFKFNVKEHQNYKGPYPEPKDYGHADMSRRDGARFLQWYNSIEPGSVFDIKKEIVSYCRQDVTLLRKGVMKFRQMLREIFDFDPFVSCATIASVCMSIYRAHYMPVNTIAVMPAGGLRKNEKQSVKALIWLKYLSETEKIQIQHAQNGGEVKIEVAGGVYKIDGQDRQNRNQLFEFHGCLWHGHPKCHPVRYLRVPGSNTTFEQAYRATMDKEQKLKAAGYQLKSVWECELSNALQKDAKMKAFFTDHQDLEPMDPRLSLYGGRTCAMRMICKTDTNEKIKYLDIISLYPYICKYRQFPIKCPVIFTEGFEDLRNEPYFGIIKCDVLAPRGLLHPVLPYKSDGKLMFALCRSCTDSKNQKSCEHSDSERVFKGVWCTPEIYTALRNGYKVVKVHEVYHYAESSGDLFAGYINAFLKIKQQGKFGQRSNLVQTVYCTDVSHMQKIVNDPRIDVSSCDILGENCVRVQYKSKDDFVEAVPNTNCVIAAFVTCYARLRLYEHLQTLGERALYCDTDSIIYLVKPGQSEPATGDHLGDMRDELQQDDHIVKFAAAGPKAYSYVTAKGEAVVKMKGVSVGRGNCSPTFEDFEERVHSMIQSGCDEGITFTYDGIVIDGSNHLLTKPRRKQFRALNNKLCVLPDFTTLPYGY